MRRRNPKAGNLPGGGPGAQNRRFHPLLGRSYVQPVSVRLATLGMPPAVTPNALLVVLDGVQVSASARTVYGTAPVTGGVYVVPEELKTPTWGLLPATFKV